MPPSKIITDYIRLAKIVIEVAFWCLAPEMQD